MSNHHHWLPVFSQEVVDTAVSLSLGEAIVATANGDVVAAKDMVPLGFFFSVNATFQGAKWGFFYQQTWGGYPLVI